METVFATALFVTSTVFVIESVASFKTMRRNKKQLIKLCNENAELLCKNNKLAAEIFTIKCRQEKDLEVVRSANLIVSQDLDAARAENSKLQDTVKQLKLKLAASENKFKQAAEHINVLRIDLNRKNNRRKK